MTKYSNTIKHKPIYTLLDRLSIPGIQQASGTIWNNQITNMPIVSGCVFAVWSRFIFMKGPFQLQSWRGNISSSLVFLPGNYCILVLFICIFLFCWVCMMWYVNVDDNRIQCPKRWYLFQFMFKYDDTINIRGRYQNVQNRWSWMYHIFYAFVCFVIVVCWNCSWFLVYWIILCSVFTCTGNEFDQVCIDNVNFWVCVCFSVNH